MSNKNIYEIGLLINPDLSQQGAEEAVKKVKKLLADNGASLISEGEVVDIDLAYQIITKIASKNKRFDQSFFSWIKFETEPSTQVSIKQDLDKIKREIFRYLIIKTVKDDEATNKYQKIEDIQKENLEDSTIEQINLEKKSELDIVDTTREDDLTKIEGIGPKIAETLNLSGIISYEDLAEKSSQEINEIISEVAGNHNPETWAKQSRLASENKWDELEIWQEQLNGGEEK